jgi:hypothetical protein
MKYNNLKIYILLFLIMGIIKKTDFDNDVKQLEHLTDQIKQMNYNDNKSFNETIYMFHTYFSSLSVKIHEIMIKYKYEKKINHLDPESEEGIKLCLSTIEVINDYLNSFYNQNISLFKINFNNLSPEIKHAQADFISNYEMIKIANRNSFIMNLLNLINSLKHFFKKSFDDENKASDCYF